MFALASITFTAPTPSAMAFAFAFASILIMCVALLGDFFLQAMAVFDGVVSFRKFRAFINAPCALQFAVHHVLVVICSTGVASNYRRTCVVTVDPELDALPVGVAC
jgi:hypothetical protein